MDETARKPMLNPLEAVSVKAPGGAGEQRPPKPQVGIRFPPGPPMFPRFCEQYALRGPRLANAWRLP